MAAYQSEPRPEFAGMAPGLNQGAPDGNYSFYYHKNISPADSRGQFDSGQDELGYEDVIKNGRMENVLGG